jgi:hypothetical protein
VKRNVILAATVVAVSVGTATPALAFWTAGAQSNNATGFAKAVKLDPIPAGSATSTRPKKGAGAGIPTFQITVAAPGAVGYHVTLGGDPVCDITGATGSCAASTPTGYDGGRIFSITAFAGPWVASSSVLCTYHDANDETVTCS